MVKAIRIISIAIFAMSAVLLVYAVVISMRKDSKIREFIKQPGAAEKYASDKGRAAPKGEGQTSPLVNEALKWSKEYLNPPPPPPPVAPVAQPSEPAPMAQVSAKFNLVGTSYYAGRPGTSFALIDEPGQGLHWVREGNSVGHLLIDKVNDGSITVRDGSRTFEMNVTVKELWQNLVKGASENRPPASPDASRGGSASSDTSAESQRISPAAAPTALPAGAAPPAISRPGIRNRQTDGATLRRAGRTTQPPTLNQPAPQNMSAQQRIEPPQPSPAEQAASIAALKETLKKQLNDAKTSRVSPDEAKQMEELVEALKRLEQIERQNADPNT